MAVAGAAVADATVVGAAVVDGAVVEAAAAAVDSLVSGLAISAGFAATLSSSSPHDRSTFSRGESPIGSPTALDGWCERSLSSSG